MEKTWGWGGGGGRRVEEGRSSSCRGSLASLRANARKHCAIKGLRQRKISSNLLPPSFKQAPRFCTYEPFRKYLIGTKISLHLTAWSQIPAKMSPRGESRGGAGKSSASSNKATLSTSLRSASGSGKSTPKASAKATAQEPSESEFESDATPSPD